MRIVTRPAASREVFDGAGLCETATPAGHVVIEQEKQAPMKLYHCERSRSTRVLWLLEELELEYDIEVLPFDRKALRSVDYLAINPFGKVPVLVDDTVTMFESVAIIQYLLYRYGDGRLEPPLGSAEYGQYLQWLHFGESTLMGPVGQVALHTLLLPEAERDPGIAAEGRRVFRHYARELDRHFGTRDYVVDNEFTAADIVIGYTLYVADACQELPEELKTLRAYYERLRARPAFRKAFGMTA
jgi:glutathione S-transferase